MSLKLIMNHEWTSIWMNSICHVKVVIMTPFVHTNLYICIIARNHINLYNSWSMKQKKWMGGIKKGMSIINNIKMTPS
jgi:hypothetical protein